MKKFIIITSINKKTGAISEFEKKKDWHIVIVGDKKSKPIECTENLTFLSVDDQQNLGLAIVDQLPYNHYTRKNIGYLYAIQNGADVIYDTDDDNIPYPDWALEDFGCKNLIQADSNFINIYTYFTDEFIWPRGFPLELVSDKEELAIKTTSTVKVGIWQGLADLDPDVDSIYRLIFNEPITFKRREPVALPKGKYCPFNSQNTFWSRDAFPLLYLPATTSFRFTDILRSFIAQRLLWTAEMHLGFHQATVYQERNHHDLMKDFKDEVECFLNSRKVIKVLQEIKVSNDPLVNLGLIYFDLYRNMLIGIEELSVLDAWRKDFEKASQKGKSI